jgi:hypothetical protein
VQLDIALMHRTFLIPYIPFQLTHIPFQQERKYRQDNKKKNRRKPHRRRTD